MAHRHFILAMFTIVLHEAASKGGFSSGGGWGRFSGGWGRVTYSLRGRKYNTNGEDNRPWLSRWRGSNETYVETHTYYTGAGYGPGLDGYRLRAVSAGAAGASAIPLSLSPTVIVATIEAALNKLYPGPGQPVNRARKESVLIANDSAPIRFDESVYYWDLDKLPQLPAETITECDESLLGDELIPRENSTNNDQSSTAPPSGCNVTLAEPVKCFRNIEHLNTHNLIRADGSSAVILAWLCAPYEQCCPLECCSSQQRLHTKFVPKDQMFIDEVIFFFVVVISAIVLGLFLIWAKCRSKKLAAANQQRAEAQPLATLQSSTYTPLE